jgi:hypothetical protein
MPFWSSARIVSTTPASPWSSECVAAAEQAFQPV